MSRDEKIALGVFIGLAGLILVGWGYTVPESGFPSKTLWDWMQLAVMPLALAVIASVFSRSEKRNEIAIAQDNQRETALQGYFDRMSELLLKENLRGAEEGSEIRSVARARTLAILRGLDGRRKGSLLNFLQETQLISGKNPIIDLRGANLQQAALGGANLTGIDLRETDLTGANLRFARLGEADLSGATLHQADMTLACLHRANLTGADLREAKLGAADLSGANLTMAAVRKAQLETARSVDQATLPNIFLANDDEDSEMGEDHAVS